MEPSIESPELERARAAPALAALREALAGAPGFLVGGAVRDAMLGREPAELDVAVEADLDPVVERLGGAGVLHERFGTATLELGGRRVDLARTRAESYARPGALPDVTAAPIHEDLRRRDFTVNALAVPLAGPLELLDPGEGAADLRAGLLRVIHAGSFSDDPTRALRAARYAARLGFELESETAELATAADLSTVSGERVAVELRRAGAEREAARAFELIDGWGLVAIGSERLALIGPASELVRTEPWAAIAERAELLAGIATCSPEQLEKARRLAAHKGGEAAAYELAAAHERDALVLVVARLLGAGWLDVHLAEWRNVRLQITGEDLIAAGVAEGPGVGRGLRAALHARIEGRIDASREAELDAALAALRAGR